MIHKRYAAYVFAVILTGGMTFVVSGMTTLINIGLPIDFAQRWMSAWLPTWAIAFPVLLLMRPFVQRLTDWITQ